MVSLSVPLRSSPSYNLQPIFSLHQSSPAEILNNPMVSVAESSDEEADVADSIGYWPSSLSLTTTTIRALRPVGHSESRVKWARVVNMKISQIKTAKIFGCGPFEDAQVLTIAIKTRTPPATTTEIGMAGTIAPQIQDDGGETRDLFRRARRIVAGACGRNGRITTSKQDLK